MPKESPVERVYSALRDQIATQKFSPNESLIEYQLADEFSVSRATVKKAILMLEQDGLVTVTANKSARVRSFSKKEVLDFLSLRQVLEGYIVRLAVPEFTQKDINEMESILAEMEKCKEQGLLVEYSENNQRFHDKIMDLCPNHLARDITATLKTQMRKYNTRTILVPGRAKHSFLEHTAIFDAIKARAPETAEQAMRFHLANVKAEFEENFELFQ